MVHNVKHKHHIVPRYEEGSDDPSNLVELTVTQHAMWHYAEWQRKKNKEDFIAWKCLSGQMSGKEIDEEVWKLAVQRRAESRRGYVTPDSTREKIAKSLKGRTFPHMLCPQRAEKISRALANRLKSDEHKAALSKSALESGQNKGERNPMFGKSAVKGRKWWINEAGETRYEYECPGVGWERGRKLRVKST